MIKIGKVNKKRFGTFLTVVFLVLFLIIFGITSCANAVAEAKERKAKIEKTLIELEKCEKINKYDEGIKLAEESDVGDDKRILEQKEILETKRAELVEYDGPIYHVFFHSLIVYPELAFDGDYKHEGYDMWMTTVSEFKAMLPQMYERGYVLYPLNEVKKDKKIKLPAGKKPLIISIDDVNYYKYMEDDGFADKLIVNEKGEVMCEVKTPQGDMIHTYDGDVMPILDEFVKAHPDFSFGGAKGVVAVTGYEGAFGYDFINAEEKDKDELKKGARRVAEALRNSGWLIACHSYTHNDYFMDAKVTYEQLESDTERFNTRIAESVLNPDIYISPFGYFLNEGDERLQYLKDMGYDYFCPVSPYMRTMHTKEGVVISERLNLDRYNMRAKKEMLNELFFNVDTVYYKN